MAALLPEAGANFAAVYENQNDLDAGFDAFMDEEYDEDKIGELDEEDVQAQTKISKKVLDEACDEFIEDKKRWFMDLAKEFGDERAVTLFPPVKSSEVIHEEDLKNGEEPEEIKQKLREKKFANAEGFVAEADDAPIDVDDFYHDKDEEDDAWDAETILSTYTNTDNHPGLIKTTRRVRPSQRMKIELHKQFKVPMDGLIPLAEEITLAKEKKAEVGNNPFTRVPKEKPPGSPRETASDASEGEEAEGQEFDKKAHKKLVKSQQREKRKLKKQLKQAFSSTLQSEVAKGVVEHG